MSRVVNRFILVVDDQPLVADTLVLVLRQAKCLAVACYSAQDALSISRAVLPDVLLCDVVLDAASGIDVALAVRTLAPTCKIILMSGNNVATEMMKGANSLAAEFPLLAKPIPPHDLIDLLENQAMSNRVAAD